jgi:hypothetical protein
VARKPTSYPDGILLQVGFNAIAEALGLAAVKAVVAITGIIAGGRLVCTVVSVQMEWLYVQQSWNYVLRI